METGDLALFFFGIVCLLAPIELRKDVARADARRARTMGIVIGHESQTCSGDFDSHSIRTKHAKILFEVDGTPYECISSVGASYTLHSVGSSVDVLYDPDNCSNADIATGPLLLMLPRLLLYGFPVVGLVLLTIGLFRVIG